MTTNATDFSRLLSAAKVLATRNDVSGAKTLFAAATALLPASSTGLCGKCLKRRQNAIEALRKAEAQLRDGAAVDSKDEQAAAA